MTIIVLEKLLTELKRLFAHYSQFIHTGSMFTQGRDVCQQDYSRDGTHGRQGSDHANHSNHRVETVENDHWFLGFLRTAMRETV